ncbi:hypothetical protein ABPG74_016892 [Tetrahymena malaccensis]
MKKLARKIFDDTQTNDEDLKIEDKDEKSQITHHQDKQNHLKNSRQNNQKNIQNQQNDNQIILKTKQDYQMKLCVDLLSFIHKNILAQILASLVAIEKIKGQKDFKDKFNNDVINIQVQCSRLMILTDYLDKWISIDADKDCIINPNLNELMMRAVKIENISSNLGSDIQEQYSQFLNLIYSTYALIYESGLKQNSNQSEQSKINKTNGNIEKQLDQTNGLNQENQNIMLQEQIKQEQQLQQQQEVSQNKQDQILQNKAEIEQYSQQSETHNENSKANQNSVIQDRKKQKIQLGSFELMFKSMKFLIKKEEAKIMTEKLQINPTPEQIILAWRMYEIVPEVKTMFSLQLERINYCNKFFFPRLAKRIDLRYLLQNTSKYFVFPSNLPEKEKSDVQEKIQQCLNQTKYVPQFHHFLHSKQQQYQQQLSTADFIASVLYNRPSLSYQSNFNQGRTTYNSQNNSFLFSQQRNSTKELFNINQKDPINKVKVRIMSQIQLENSFDARQGNDDTLFNKLSSIMCISRDKTPGHQFNGYSSQNQNGGNDNLNEEGQMIPKKKINLILHIHGGGFVAMNTFSHQIYTRKWANQVDDSVIVSVDYRKAPEHRYPAAIDDVWQVYNFVINYFEDIFTNIQIHTITLAGDSAGGNLCMSLMNLIIQEELYRKPTGILLSYPALNLNGNSYTPSSLHSMLDVVLPSSFLKICLESYLPSTSEYLNETFVKYDSLLSPILIQDSVLQQFPPISIFCGEEDPLYDDSLRLFHRTRILKDPMYIQIIEQFEEKKKQNVTNNNNKLLNQGSFGEEHFIDSQNEILQNQSHISTMTVYPKLKHGYLNLDFPFGVPLVRKCVQQSIDSLKKLIQQSQNNLNVQNPRSSTLRSQLIRSSYKKSNENNSSFTPSKQIQTCPDQFNY